MEIRRIGRTVLAGAACAGLALAAAAEGARAQQATPRVPAGVKLAILPVQDVSPAPSGAWPGGASSRTDALDRMNAELDFALSSSESAARWPGPRELTRMVERNPMIDAHPHRLAVGRLASVEPGEGQIGGTLHRQLRRLSALAGVRIVAIPLRLAWRPPDRAADSAAGADTAGGSAAGPGRPVLEMALVDTRAARVLWRGDVPGAAGPPGKPGALASLAANLVGLLSP